jgi:hypothetical protein
MGAKPKYNEILESDWSNIDEYVIDEIGFSVRVTKF